MRIAGRRGAAAEVGSLAARMGGAGAALSPDLEAMVKGGMMQVRGATLYTIQWDDAGERSYTIYYPVG